MQEHASLVIIVGNRNAHADNSPTQAAEQEELRRDRVALEQLVPRKESRRRSDGGHSGGVARRGRDLYKQNVRDNSARCDSCVPTRGTVV